MFLVQIWLSASVTSCHDDQGSTSVWSPHAPSSFNQRQHLTKRGPPFRLCCRSRVWAVCGAFVWAFYFVLFCYILFFAFAFASRMCLGCARQAVWRAACSFLHELMMVFAFSSARSAHTHAHAWPGCESAFMRAILRYALRMFGAHQRCLRFSRSLPAGMIGIFASGPLITQVSRSSQRAARASATAALPHATTLTLARMCRLESCKTTARAPCQPACSCVQHSCECECAIATRTHRALVWVCACVLTLRVHVRGCGGARVAVTDALGGAKGGGRWTALEGGIVTVAHCNSYQL